MDYETTEEGRIREQREALERMIDASSGGGNDRLDY